MPARPPAEGRTTPAHLRAGAASTAPDGICAGGERICNGGTPLSRSRSAVKALCFGGSGLPALPHPSNPCHPPLSLLSSPIARRCADAPDGAASNAKSRLADGVGCLKRGLTLAPAGADGPRARQWRMPPGQVCGGGCHLRSIHLHECTNEDTLAWSCLNGPIGRGSATERSGHLRGSLCRHVQRMGGRRRRMGARRR